MTDLVCVSVKTIVRLEFNGAGGILRGYDLKLLFFVGLIVSV